MKFSIPYEVAVNAYGSEPNLNPDAERAAFFVIWAFLEAELQEALKVELNSRTKENHQRFLAEAAEVSCVHR